MNPEIIGALFLEMYDQGLLPVRYICTVPYQSNNLLEGIYL